jgi:hypothetical protein
LRRELLSIIATLAPNAIVSHRSALESGVTPAGEVHLTGPYRRDIELPGVKLRIRKGPGPRSGTSRFRPLRGPHVGQPNRGRCWRTCRSHARTMNHDVIRSARPWWSSASKSCLRVRAKPP